MCKAGSRIGVLFSIAVAGLCLALPACTFLADAAGDRTITVSVKSVEDGSPIESATIWADLRNRELNQDESLSDYLDSVSKFRFGITDDNGLATHSHPYIVASLDADAPYVLKIDADEWDDVVEISPEQGYIATGAFVTVEVVELIQVESPWGYQGEDDS